MDVSTWCVQNNITKANYYYRLRRVREACLAMTGQESPTSFVELEEPVLTDVTVPKCTSRIKGLLWEGDGFLLLYKRLDTGAFSWPRTKEEAVQITREQYGMLMQGLEIISRHPITEVNTHPSRM